LFYGLQSVRSTCTWASAIVLAGLPGVIALDYGGVLRWTHYALAIAALAAVLLAVPSLLETDGPGNWRRHRLLIPLLIWIGFAWMQTILLSPSIVSRLSPASAHVYENWTAPYLEPQTGFEAFSISVAPHDSRHALAMLSVVVAVMWASAQVFHSRARIGLLLCAIALSGTLHALIGIWRIVFPETLAWSAIADTAGQSFGAFVNRNNAALFLNLGLAASLGLLSWRLTAMTGLEVDDPTFEYNDLFSLISDRESVIGVLGVATCLTGLLICGSRGGVVSALMGGLLAFGWVRQRRGLISFPVVGAVIAIAVALLVVPFNLNLESLRRFDFSGNLDESTILRDGRIKHWRDGAEAAVAYFPAGSGLSTYAYAHLPFKQTGPHAWYHHADNLWLELCVEQGLVGICLSILIGFFLIRSLLGLNLSRDPLDQGLRTTGWYALGAIFVSQVFDFGLIVPANLFAVAILMATIVARDATMDLQVASGHAKGFLTARRYQIRTTVLAVIAVLAALLPLPHLRRDAESESKVRVGQLELAEGAADPARLRALVKDLSDSYDREPRAEVSSLLSDVKYRLARITEVMESHPRNEIEAAERYRQTGMIPRRLAWRQESANSEPTKQPNPSLQVESTSYYADALASARQTLKNLPLDSMARTKVIYLDFVHRDPALTSLALRQLRQFYQNHPEMLVRLGVFAADSGETDLAIEMWQSALRDEPAHTDRVLAQTLSRSEIELRDVVPGEPRNRRAAAKYLLAKDSGNDSFLSELLSGMNCESCRRLDDRAQCEQLEADLLFKLGRFDEAFLRYRSAIELTPADKDLRLKLIMRLRDQGQNREARSEAQVGREKFPQDGRFDLQIKELAAKDLRELETQPHDAETVAP
jgi:tetratricopeptide (TPR) repeat protein